LSLIAHYIIKQELSLRIMSNFFTWASYQPVVKAFFLEDQDFYSGFSFVRLPTMASEFCLPTL
jgi:hypothetical protein